MPDSHSYEVSTDKNRFDLGVIHHFLQSSYWAKGIPRRLVEKSIQHSFCFGAFCGTEQVGFARVITDFTTFAYLADVFVVPEHRGRGVSKLMMRTILAHSELQGLRRFLLATHDAHGLYRQFGFEPLAHPDHFLTRHQPQIHQISQPDNPT